MWRRILPVIISLLWLAGMQTQAFSDEALDPGWDVVSVGSGASPVFDIGPDGRVHVAAASGSMAGPEIHYGVASSTSGPWSLSAIFTGYTYGPTDLRVDQDNDAHLAFHDHVFDGGSPKHLVIDPMGGVTTNNITSPGHDGWDGALAVDSLNRVHLIGIYPTGFGPDPAASLEYGLYNGSSWPGFGAVSGTGVSSYGLGTSLDTDSDNYPHAAYTVAPSLTDPGDLKYSYKDAGGWHVSTVVGGDLDGRFPSIALDSSDRPHIAWLDIDPMDTSQATIQYGVLDGGIWDIETVDTVEHLVTALGRNPVSLALDENDQPHLTFSDQRNVVYATKPDAAWEETTVAASDVDLYNAHTILRLDPNENPSILIGQGAQIRLATLLGPAIPGDYDGNGSVGPEDYSLWRSTFGATSGDMRADGNGNNVIDAADYALWRDALGAGGGGAGASGLPIPEPVCAELLIVGAILLEEARRRLAA